MDDNADRTITRTYDAYDRAAKIVYGKGEVKTFAYNAYGRLVKRGGTFYVNEPHPGAPSGTARPPLRTGAPRNRPQPPKPACIP